VGCALAKLGYSAYSACKNFSAQQEPKYVFFRKSRFGRVPTHIPNFVVGGRKCIGFFAKRGRNRCRKRRPGSTIFDIFIYSEDNCGQRLNVLNCAKFCMSLAPFGGPLNFWICVIKPNQIAIMWQSFTAIGRWSSEISI